MARDDERFMAGVTVSGFGSLTLSNAADVQAHAKAYAKAHAQGALH